VSLDRGARARRAALRSLGAGCFGADAPLERAHRRSAAPMEWSGTGAVTTLDVPRAAMRTGRRTRGASRRAAV